MPPPPPPPKRSSSRGWIILAVSLCVLALLAFVGLFILGMLGAEGGGTISHAQGGGAALQEVLVKNNGSDNKLAVVSVEGVITGSAIDGSGTSPVDYIKQQLKRAADDEDVKAVMLKVDSPGGEVLASDEIYDAIRKFQEDKGKPVIAVMHSMAASGGYYVSAPCRWIVAHELTITGSIGVIMQGYNFRGLMDKVGVQPQVFKSGKFKDMMSSTKPADQVTDEEKAMMQELINEAYGRFKSIVADGREYAVSKNKDQGRKLVDNWTDYADGRILTGKQAFEHGFVDEIGDFDAAVKRTLKLAGIQDANLVKYQKLFTFGNLFQLLGKSDVTSVKVDIGLDMPKVQTGRMYFLPGYYLH